MSTLDWQAASAVFNLDREVPRHGQRAELLESWYLRFNGFFPLTNFILHDAGAAKQAGGQLTDADVMAVRLPNVEELIERPDGNQPIRVQPDPSLDVKPGLWDFAIAEVTCRPPHGECKFNWITDSGTIKASYLEYCLRRFGFWDSAAVPMIARRVSEERSYRSLAPMPVRVRLVSFGVSTSEGLPGIQQVTFEQVLAYLQGPLFGCYGDSVVSAHSQWHPMICEVYNRLRGHKAKPCTPQEVLTWLFPGVSPSDGASGDRPAGRRCAG